MKHYKRLTWTDRLYIAAALDCGMAYATIAANLGVHRSTIYREIARAPKFEHRDGKTWLTSIKYSPDLAHTRAVQLASSRSIERKITRYARKDEFLELLEWYMASEHYSPAAALAAVYAKMPDAVRISHVTLYKYIDSGTLFSRVTNAVLPEKCLRKRRYRKVHNAAAKAPRGTSIEKRPDISQRDTAGHWEMDCIISAKNGKEAFLTLTERKTRYEIAFVLPRKTSKAVVSALDRLEHRLGCELFRRMFRSITVDNGGEFADCAGMERSVFGGHRTTVYYCHPYSSWERGSNERANRIIRRKFPKGTVFNNISEEELSDHTAWINDYPRKILNWRCASEMFEAAFDGVLP